MRMICGKPDSYRQRFPEKTRGRSKRSSYCIGACVKRDPCGHWWRYRAVAGVDAASCEDILQGVGIFLKSVSREDSRKPKCVPTRIVSGEDMDDS
ncbi:hypothetical protein AVEN_180850-1 [Araneus ventricosus]|uniref:Uncharacterized protein n=1 Tax=Araneus ventricosus TaxID=182803 RepID=A0A4Y2HAG0_ARAVE|nr:hypothetical protein AVEN_180850-1 [Araneus ventricosus]